MQKSAAITIAGILVAILSFCLGAAVTAYESGDDLNKFVLPFLSMAGAWVSGVGSLAAVIAALHIASMQATEQRTSETVKCVHHALAVVEDLRARVSYQKQIIFEGGRPISALTTNAQGIERRYETLYDREIYQYLPEPLIDRITSLSGKLFGLLALSTAIASLLSGEQHAMMPVRSSGTKNQEDDVDRLVLELGHLYEELCEFRSSVGDHAKRVRGGVGSGHRSRSQE